LHRHATQKDAEYISILEDRRCLQRRAHQPADRLKLRDDTIPDPHGVSKQVKLDCGHRDPADHSRHHSDVHDPAQLLHPSEATVANSQLVGERRVRDRSSLSDILSVATSKHPVHCDRRVHHEDLPAAHPPRYRILRLPHGSDILAIGHSTDLPCGLADDAVLPAGDDHPGGLH